jgi:outer membrane protein assembly factor BamA
MNKELSEWTKLYTKNLCSNKKNEIKLLFFTILLCCNLLNLLPAYSQKVAFDGLKRTQSTYLLKLIGWTDSTRADSSAIEEAVQKIKNTRLFSEVNAKIVVSKTDTVIVFSCKEVKSFLPIGEFGATQGNTWLRLGVLDENGKGRGIRTVFFYQYNDRHSFYLKQSFPLVFNQWGISYLLRKWSFLEPFIFSQNRKEIYSYNNWNAEMYVNHAFEANRHELEMGMGFIKEEFMHTMPNKYADSPNLFLQNKFSFKGIHNLNYLNFNGLYVSKWANTFNVLGTYEVKERMPFVSIFNDFRFFKKFAFKGNFAFRNRLGISSDVNVFLAPFVLDNYFNIRGIGNRVDRGTASIVINLEYRQTLWENNTFGVQAVGFCDSGSWRKSGKQIADMIKSENMLVFMGLGGRLVYKKAFDTILRLDYGWGVKGIGSGFVFGIGQYF